MSIKKDLPLTANTTYFNQTQRSIGFTSNANGLQYAEASSKIGTVTQQSRRDFELATDVVKEAREVVQTWSALAKGIGVSDGAVRKWAKALQDGQPIFAKGKTVKALKNLIQTGGASIQIRKRGRPRKEESDNDLSKRGPGRPRGSVSAVTKAVRNISEGGTDQIVHSLETALQIVQTAIGIARFPARMHIVQEILPSAVHELEAVIRAK